MKNILHKHRRLVRVGRIGRVMPAFTLIEILIAVLVLALGLLGLGAVFPVVVRQQRQSADVVLGITALRSAETYILSHGKGIVRPPTITTGRGWLNEKSLKPAPWTLPGAQQQLNARGLDAWGLAEAQITLGGGGGDEKMTGWGLPNYKWMPEPLASVVAKDVTTKPEDRCALRIGYKIKTWPTGPAPANSTETVIPLSQRLFPQPDSSGEQPQYVWDFVGRRVLQGSWTSQAVQLAIFVRRIDAGIQVPKGKTLSDVLLNRRLALGEQRVPVGANYTVGTTGWVNQSPTLNGSGNYSPIMMCDFKFTGENRLTFIPPPGSGSDANSPIRRAIRQIGQKLVDNRGNVYTVIRLEEKATASDKNDTVYIDAKVSQPEITQSTTTTYGEPYPFSIAFTPQIPAAVSVLTIPR